jgi:hypothetical protein
VYLFFFLPIPSTVLCGLVGLRFLGRGREEAQGRPARVEDDGVAIDPEQPLQPVALWLLHLAEEQVQHEGWLVPQVVDNLRAEDVDAGSVHRIVHGMRSERALVVSLESPKLRRHRGKPRGKVAECRAMLEAEVFVVLDVGQRRVWLGGEAVWRAVAVDVVLAEWTCSVERQWWEGMAIAIS